MKISPVISVNIHNQSFGAGKTSFYTDFDGTFFPFRQETLKQRENNPELTIMNKMYTAFKKFASIAENKFNILITTGRGRKEMETVLQYIKAADINFCTPHECILRDGLDEFQFEDGNNEYRLNHNANKKTKNAEALRSAAENVIRSVGQTVSIIQSGVNKSMENNDEESLKYKFNNMPVENRKRYVSIVTEDNGLIEIAFSPNIDTKEYEKKFEKFFKNNKLSYKIISSKSDHNFYIPYQEDDSEDYKYVPANSLILKPLINNKTPDKIDQPKAKIKRIVDVNSNDLVIVAGDASNDYSMLNPLNYLDIYGIDIDTAKSNEEILSNPEVINAIKKLPLISICVGNNESLQGILEIKKILDSMGIHKILTAQDSKNDLLDRIKHGMLIYSDINSEYKYNLGYDLYSEILE